MRGIIFFLICSTVLASAAYAQDTLQLDEALNLGLENNFGIKLVRNNVQIARNNNTYGNAGFYPEIAATGAYDNSLSNTEQRFFDGRVRSAENAKTSSLNGGLLLNWTIFQGFNLFVAKNTLEELQQLEELEARMEVERVVASVIVTYYNIVQQTQRVAVLEDAVSLSSERRNLARYRYELGSASQLDVYQAGVDFNADTAALVREKNLLVSLKTDLNSLLARDASTQFSVSDSIMVETSIKYDDLLEKVKSQNAQLFLARTNLSLAALNSRFWSSQYYPAVSLYSGYNYINSTSEVGLLQSNLNYGPSYGVRATFNILNGFSTRRNVQNARILQESAQLGLQQTELQVQNEVYKFYADYEAALRLLDLERENVVLADSNLVIAVEKYRLGAIYNVELREIQLKQIDARVRYLRALFEAKLAETELLRYAGTLIP